MPRRCLWLIWLIPALLGALLLAPRPARAGEVVVALDVAGGPQLILPYGAPEAERALHTGLVFSTRIIVDPKSLREQAEALPWPWKLVALKTKVVRWNPIPYVPDSFIVSPGLGRGSALGLSWRVADVGVALAKQPRFTLSGAGRLTWISFFGGDTPATHFLRPGIEVRAELEIPLSQVWFLAVGYSSQLYIPQAWGAAPWRIGPREDWLWHVGQIYLSGHRRQPDSITW